MEEPAWATVFCFSALASLARAHVRGDVAVLADPKCETAYQRPGLGAPEVSAKGAVVALSKHLPAQPPSGGYAEAVRLALPATIQQSTTYQEGPTFR